MTTQTSRQTPLQTRRADRWRAGAPALAGLTLGLLTAVLLPLAGPSTYKWTVTAIVLAASLALSLVDEATFTLPNRFVAALAVFAASQIAAASLLQHSVELALSAAAASAIVAVVYAVLAIAGWVGFGDMKFAAALTLAVAVVAGMFAAYIPVLAILVSWARILLRRVRRRPDRHPHGLSLAIASIAVMLLFL